MTTSARSIGTSQKEWQSPWLQRENNHLKLTENATLDAWTVKVDLAQADGTFPPNQDVTNGLAYIDMADDNFLMLQAFMAASADGRTCTMQVSEWRWSSARLRWCNHPICSLTWTAGTKVAGNSSDITVSLASGTTAVTAATLLYASNVAANVDNAVSPLNTQAQGAYDTVNGVARVTIDMQGARWIEVEMIKGASNDGSGFEYSTY